MSAPPRFTYDPVAHRYRGSSGKFLSAEQVHGYIVDYSVNLGTALRDLTQQLRQGALSVAEWQLAMAAELKAGHIAAAMAAAGGRQQMTPALWGAVGQRLREEYRFLSAFADGIASGQIPLDGRVLQRADQYGRDVRETYQRIMQRELARRGVDEVRNIRHAQDSCQGCIDAEALGFVPLAQMTFPGTRQCRANCLCTLQHRNSATGQVFG